MKDNKTLRYKENTTDKIKHDDSVNFNYNKKREEQVITAGVDYSKKREKQVITDEVDYSKKREKDIITAIVNYNIKRGKQVITAEVDYTKKQVKDIKTNKLVNNKKLKDDNLKKLSLFAIINHGSDELWRELKDYLNENEEDKIFFQKFWRHIKTRDWKYYY